MQTIDFHLNLIDMQPSLLRYANSLTNDREYARDLVQETTLKALWNSDSFVIESNFRAWVYTIMKNTFINNYRQSVRQNTIHVNERELLSLNHFLSDGSCEADSVYSVKEMTGCIEELNEMFRIPFKMHLSGYKYKEIADELHLNIGTIKSRIFLSRKKIQELLAK